MRAGAVAVWTLALAACGRLGFDGGGVSAIDADADIDAPPGSGICHRSGVAPNPLTVTGHVFHYLTFDGQLEGVPSTVTAFPEPGGPPLDMKTTDSDGGFSLSIDTGKRPQPLFLRAAVTGYFTSSLWIDYAVEHALVGPNSPHIRPGDIPIWTGGSLVSVYGSHTPSLTRSDSAGTLAVIALDCDENPVDDVTITLDPPAATPNYLGDSGMFDTTANATVGAYAQAVFLNAVPGPVTIHATHASHVFAPYDISIAAGENVSVAIIHVADPD